MALSGRPTVLIYQDFATASFNAPLPTLNCLLVGPCYFIQDYATDKASIGAGVFGTVNGAGAASTGAAPSTTAISLTDAPNDVAGAVVDQASVELWMDSANVNLTNGGSMAFTTSTNILTGFSPAASENAPVKAGVLPGDRFVITDTTNNVTIARTVQNALLTFADSAATGSSAFNSATVNVQVGDTLTITLPANKAGTFSVVEIVNGTTLYVVPSTPKAYDYTIASGTTKYTIGNATTPNKVATSDTSVTVVDSVIQVTSNILSSNGTDINGVAYATLETTGLVGRIERQLSNQKVGGVGVSGPVTMTSGSNAMTIIEAQTLPVILAGATTATNLPVNSANTYIAYRSLRQDLAKNQSVVGTSGVTGLLGRVDERNPLAVAASIAVQNTSSAVQVYGVVGDNLNGNSDLVTAHGDAITALGGDNTIYAVVPLTQNLTVIQDWLADCVAKAQPSVSMFRIVLGSHALITQSTIAPAGGGSSTGTSQSQSGLLINVLSDASATYLTAPAVMPGNYLVVTAATGTELGTPPDSFLVLQVISTTELVVANSTPFASAGNATAVAYHFSATAGGSAIPGVYTATSNSVYTRAFYNQLLDNTAAFITNGVIVGDLIEVLSAPSGGTVTASFPVTAITSNNVLTVATNTATELPSTSNGESPSTSIYYQVNRNLTKDQQVAALDAITYGPGALQNSRCTMVWPDSVLVSGVTNALTGLQSVQPSYYAAAGVGGMIAGLPSQQGFTFLSVAGIQQAFDSTGYFSQAQLNTLSGNGWFVLVQDTATGPVYCMREMTTDTTTLETGELMTVKNFDYISIFFKNILQGFLGRYNIVPETIQYISEAFGQGATKLQNQTISKLGAPLLSAQLVSIAPLAGTSDRLEMYANITMPVPLNDIGLHLTA